MRRKDREITDGEKIREIIEGCGCLRLGLCDDEGMYIVPLNFGAVCEAGQWYFYCHGASAGRKEKRAGCGHESLRQRRMAL